MKTFATEAEAGKIALNYNQAQKGLYEYEVVMTPKSEYVIAITQVDEMKHVGYVGGLIE